jgi:hypothetical protein
MPESTSKRKNRDIAAEIDVYLKKFEASKKINRPRKGNSISPYYNAGCWDGGRYVNVKYVEFQGTSCLSKAEALKYLEWLKAGNIGRHYAALK